MFTRNISRVVLLITAGICVGVGFSFINDPEGPNLVVTVGGSLIVYLVSLLAYASNLPVSKKFWLALLIQMLMVTVFYFVA